MGATPKAKSKLKKLLLISLGSVAGLFFILMAVGVIAIAMQPGGWKMAMAEQYASQAAEDQRKAEEEQAAKASAATEKDRQESAEAKAKQEAAEAEAAKTPQERISESAGVDGIKVSISGGVILASFDINDNLTSEMITTGAQSDTIQILKAVAEQAGEYERVYVVGSFPMTDPYGNTEDKAIIDLVYSKATVDKINFDGIDPDRVWDIRDGGEVHPELTKR